MHKSVQWKAQTPFSGSSIVFAILLRCRVLLKMNESLFESFNSDSVGRCDLWLQCRPESVIKRWAFNSVLRAPWTRSQSSAMRNYDWCTYWWQRCFMRYWAAFVINEKKKPTSRSACVFAKENVSFPVVLKDTLQQNGGESCNLHFQNANQVIVAVNPSLRTRRN